eukprot:snap_masked-scaffold_33-processed-gene-0.39-mRNA-1 protein AED:0.39 eAED:0.39 QI:0/-1/0/1/-1/1/1/0/246
MKRKFSNKSYYAVAKGRIPGIYFSWDHCKQQVDKFPGAKYKKFSDLTSANNFIELSSSSQPLSLKRKLPKSNKSSNIKTGRKVENYSYTFYTDGSCLKNRGTQYIIQPAGWGFVLLDSYRNVLSEQFGKVLVHGDLETTFGAKVTSNNTGELLAIGKSLQHVLQSTTFDSAESILFKSDSKYAMKAVLGEQNGVKNRELIDHVRSLLSKVTEKNIKVDFDFVKGHSFDKFNDMADELAKKGARLAQ